MENSLRTSYWMMIGAAAGAASVGAFEPRDLFLIQKGPVVLKPQFQASETYSDNVTYRREDKQADFLTTLSPGFELQFGSREFNFIELSYFYDRLQYADLSDLDTSQHRIGLQTHYAHSRLSLEGNDAFEFLSSPLGGGISLQGQRVDRSTIYDRYRLTYDFSDKTSLYVQGLHNFYDYQDDLPLYDQRTVTGTLGFQYKALSKIFFFGEAYYGQTDTEKNLSALPQYPRANFIGFFVGAHGQFTEHLGGTAQAGYEHRYYSDNGASLDAPVVSMSIDERFSERTLLTIAYARAENESVQYARSPYTTDSITATLRQDIGNEGRFRALLTGAYISSDFEPSPQFGIAQRHDDLLYAGLTLSYDIKLWMRALGSYNFEYLDSNAPGIINYSVNRITLGLQFGY